MSDIRGYSGTAETIDPAQLAAQLNEHRRAVNDVIMANMLIRRSMPRRNAPQADQINTGSVFERPHLMRDLAARKATPPARSHGPPTMTASIG